MGQKYQKYKQKKKVEHEEIRLVLGKSSGKKGKDKNRRNMGSGVFIGDGNEIGATGRMNDDKRKKVKKMRKNLMAGMAAVQENSSDEDLIWEIFKDGEFPIELCMELAKEEKKKEKRRAKGRNPIKTRIIR